MGYGSVNLLRIIEGRAGDGSLIEIGVMLYIVKGKSVWRTGFQLV
jgi:hypothetical protein